MRRFGATRIAGPADRPCYSRRCGEGIADTSKAILASFTFGGHDARWAGRGSPRDDGRRMQQLVGAPGTPGLDCLLLAYETSGDSIVTLALDGTLLAVNGRGAAALGFEIGGGRSWTEAWAPSDREAAREAVATAGRGAPVRLRMATASAARLAPRLWNSVITAVPGPDGAPACLLAVSRDVTEHEQAVRALDRSVRLQHALIEATSEIVWHLDTSTGITTRRGNVEFTGNLDDPNDLDGWLVSVHPDDRERAKVLADRAQVDKASSNFEYRLRHHTGTWRWVEDHATPILDQDRTVTDWVGIVTDIHDRRTAEQALQKSAEHLRLAVEANGLGTWDVNLITGEREWSPEMFDILRLSRDTAPAKHLFFDRIHPDDRRRVADELAEVGPLKEAVASTFRLTFAAGDERWIEAHERILLDQEGVQIRRVGTLQDITVRKQAELEVWRAAHTDALTGIANRALFQLRLDEAIAGAPDRHSSLALIVIDLDRFKEVNDTYGHDGGDVLLRTVAERLTAGIPSSATVARLGGDEFGVLLPAVGDADVVDIVARCLLDALGRPLVYAGRETECSVSIGWSIYPAHDDQPGALLKNADIALYAAKSAGRGRALAYTGEMRSEFHRRINVLRAAKDALARDAVLPYYQPKIALDTGAVIGFEALLRWTSDGQLRSPGAIQEALDHPELSVQLGARMLERVIADMRGWTADGLPFGHVALNVAAPELNGGRYAERILGALGDARLPSSQLEIEVTERVLMDDGSGAIGAALESLHEAGIRIALDDFGTGFASLTHLIRFPVAIVKIDRSFVMNLHSAGSATAVTLAVIDLAHKIGIKVVAEGIELEEQRRLLACQSCDFGQGYLFAKPMHASRVPFFLRQWDGGSTMPRLATAL